MNAARRSALLILGMILFLPSCRAPRDPAALLGEAADLYSSESDPAAAEELVREAMALSVARKDMAGLAEAYRQYGLFFRSTAVGRFAARYREKGFLDRKASFATRYDDSLRYFKLAEIIVTKQQRLDALSEVYLGMAKTHLLKRDLPAACEAFDLSIANHAAYRTESSALETTANARDSQEDYLKDMKQQAGCP